MIVDCSGGIQIVKLAIVENCFLYNKRFEIEKLLTKFAACKFCDNDDSKQKTFVKHSTLPALYKK